MLIVQVEPPQDTGIGDYFYRTYAPGLAMAQDEGVLVVNMTNVHRKKDHIMREADVLVLVNICDPDLLVLTHERSSKGRPTIYEIADDLGALQPWNPAYFFYKNRENLSLVYRLAKCCDAIQVTAPELKRRYGQLNVNCRIFPNQISHVPSERLPKSTNEVIIGWGGSHGHLQDVAEIAGPLIHWITNQPTAALHLMCSEPIWDLFRGLPLHKRRRTLPGSIDDYYKFLAQIDIGIAPLNNTAFNRSRSDIKFLEYAVSGVVPVMAHSEAYADSVNPRKTGFLFKDTSELIDTLDQIVANAPLRQDIARAARQYVLRERLQAQHSHDRIAFYGELLNQLHRHNPIPGGRLERFEAWSKLEAATRDGRHLCLRATHFENLLHDGLVAMQEEDHKTKARQYFEEAAKIEPQNHLPYLFGAGLSDDPVASLRKAVQLKPDSVVGWTLLGEQFAKAGKLQDALSSFDSAVALYPDYEVPYLRAGALLKTIGRTRHAENLLRKAKQLAENPVLGS